MRADYSDLIMNIQKWKSECREWIEVIRTYVHKLFGMMIPQNININLRRNTRKKTRVCVTGNAVSGGDKERLKKTAMTFTILLQEEQQTQ
ncbi:hypothetical protein DUI87_07878 [Hirundo rustica rustica]|uniref:Uncharacterized protein n=1 Tax=Hirundo rustica rustica TaxID=333673 RepID=A0A3M0KRX3_HIRRU|nr:hypothetical protein DUI87_07878 [Hirundo rustica rustica]